MKKMLVIAALLFFVILFLISYILIKGGNLLTPSGPKSSDNSSSKEEGVNEDYNKSFKEMLPQIESALEKERHVGDVLDQLPYKGVNFALYFDIDSGRYVLYINPSKKEDGNNEFNEFLRKNGVLDRGWLQDLFLMYITPTPTLSNTPLSPSSTPAP